MYDSESPDWVPTLHLGYDKVDTTSSIQQVHRYSRAQNRAHSKRRRLDHDADDESTTSVSLEELDINSKECQTDLNMSDLNQHELEISVLKKAHHDASLTLEAMILKYIATLDSLIGKFSRHFMILFIKTCVRDHHLVHFNSY